MPICQFIVTLYFIYALYMLTSLFFSFYSNQLRRYNSSSIGIYIFLFIFLPTKSQL